MKSRYHLILLLLIFSFFILKSEAQNAAGSWSGNIELPNNTKLEMVFNITKGENGKLKAELDVPQQGAAGLTVSEVITVVDSLHMKVPSILGSFSGKFVSDKLISGKWLQMGNSFNLSLKKTGLLKPVNRPQTPKPPFDYSTVQVQYINPKSGFKLAGTLTLPKDTKNCPAVVLITGSGAQDRDETIFDHKPFFVMADYFTKNGIAVLRVDDRGIGGSEGSTSDATSEDFATDVIQGVNFLKGRSQIDPTKIGLIGHSEGGMIAPLVANQSKDISFIIMMAGLGIPGDSLLIEQTELLSKNAGIPEQQINAQLFATKGLINILQKEKEPAKRTESLRNTFTGGMYKQMDADRQELVDNQLKQYDNNWFSFFVSYDPRPDLFKVQCPVLALNGEKDLQVPPGSNLPAIEKALKEGGNTDFKIMEFQNLNHLFQNCETGSPQEYSKIEETISPEVLEFMKNWLLETTED